MLDLAKHQLKQCAYSEYKRDTAIAALNADQVVLVTNVPPNGADNIMLEICAYFTMREALELQSAFACIKGHRRNVTRFFMSVNTRSSYQFIPAHSEGTRDTGIQVAAFYGYSNTTDGGVTILLNSDNDSEEWEKLREVNLRIDLQGVGLTRTQMATLRAKFDHAQSLQTTDQILTEVPSPVPGTKLLRVLSPTRALGSRILGYDVKTYWDSIASYDFDSGAGYADLLQSLGLLKMPPTAANLRNLDNALPRRLWSSGSKYERLFKGFICYKLAVGDLMVLNNLTWAHSVSNWTPESGTREIAAAFA